MRRFFLVVFLLLFSVNAMSAKLVKVELNDETYMIVDLRLNNKIKLTEGVEVFINEGKYMLPLYTFTNSLGMDVSINTEKSEFSLKFKNNETQINFLNNVIDSSLSLPSNDIAWADDGFDIYIEQEFLELLITANINAKTSNLIFDIESSDKNTTYPIETELQHKAELKDRIFRPYINKILDLGNVFIEDQYRLAMPANVYARLRSRLQETQETSISEFEDSTYIRSQSVDVTGVSDLLYHSSRYSINWDDITGTQSSINFSKYKTSPYDVLPGNVDYYSFGDVSGYASSLTTASRGVGLTFSQRDDRFSNEFGQTTIDGIAAAGWQVELYDGGYFIGETIVNDNGQFIFNEVNTRYGVNQYRIVLYGPHGEVETRYETIRIGSNWLNKGEISYRGAILDTNKQLLNSNQDSSNYEIDSVNFGFDYGLNDSTQLQLMFNQSEDLIGSLQRYLSSQIQTNFYSNALTFALAAQEDSGFATEIGLLGRLGNLDSYGINIQYADDYSLITETLDNSLVELTGSYHGEFGNKIVDLYSKSSLVEDFYRSNYNRFRISWPFIKMNMRFELLNRQYNSYSDNGLDLDLSFASLSGSGRIGDGRITLSTNQQIDGGKAQEYDFSYQQQFGSFILNTDANSTKTSEGESQWGAGLQLAYRTSHAFVNTSFDYHSESKWQISLGVDFSFNYDYQRNKFNFSSSYNQTALLDIGAYLDRNNNQILDSGDYALEGVKFGVLKSWAETPTLKNGRTLLTKVPVKNIVNVNAKWRDVVRPSQGSHTLYTHPGGLISVNIPFTITTSFAGYVLFNSGDELIGGNGIRVNLIDVSNNEIVANESADEDGYFEFYNQKPGHYFIELVSEDLTNRGLTSSHRRLDFTTPPRGGYVELEPFILQNGVEQNDKTLLVDFNDENYEPLFSGEDKDKEIYVNTTGSSIEKAVFPFKSKNMHLGSIKRTNIKLTPEVAIEDVVTELPVNNNGQNNEFTSQFTNENQGTNSNSSVLTRNTTDENVNGVIEPPKEENSFTRLEWRYGAQVAVFSSEAAANAYIASLDIKGIPVKAYYDEDNNLYRLILGELTQNLNNVETNIEKYKTSLPNIDMFAKYFRVSVSY